MLDVLCFLTFFLRQPALELACDVPVFLFALAALPRLLRPRASAARLTVVEDEAPSTRTFAATPPLPCDFLFCFIAVPLSYALPLSPWPNGSSSSLVKRK